MRSLQSTLRTNGYFLSFPEIKRNLYFSGDTALPKPKLSKSLSPIHGTVTSVGESAGKNKNSSIVSSSEVTQFSNEDDFEIAPQFDSENN